ncbi:MAG: DUF721 domain-containing protein [Elusimicrobiaceae bacterium]|nr:DUF721 domain-containing protein [Elusimicrobiaceae bacterium]
MKFGAKPRPIWSTPSDFKGKFNGLRLKLSRLVLLDHVWTKLIGDKEKFWKLTAVKGGTLYVSVRLSVARSELIGRRDGLIKELNKYFDKPWIEKIEIAKDLGARNE